MRLSPQETHCPRSVLLLIHVRQEAGNLIHILI